MSWLDIINSAIGMEIEIHLDRAATRAVFNLFAPGDNRGEEAGIVIAITSQPNIQRRRTRAGGAGIIRFHMLTAEADLACEALVLLDRPEMSTSRPYRWVGRCG